MSAPRAGGGSFRIGDRVVGRQATGTIVGNVTTGEYSPTLKSGAWNSLGEGVLVRWDDGTLTHLREPETSLRLLQGPEAAP